MSEYALDCAFSLPPPADAARLGFHGYIRYLARQSSQTAPKIWTKQQIDLVHAAGMWAGAVFEQQAEDPLKGYDRGVQDCQVAESEWAALGAPHGTVIFYAYDFDANPAAVEPYAKGIKDTASGNWPIGAYCSDAVAVDFFAKKIIDYFWQTESSGFGGTWPSPRAHLIQHTWYDLRPKLNGDYDENVLHPEVGAVPWWYPPGQGGFLMALTDAEQTEMRDEVRALKMQMGALTSQLNKVYNFLNSFPSQKPFPAIQAELDAIKTQTDKIT